MSVYTYYNHTEGKEFVINSKTSLDSFFYSKVHANTASTITNTLIFEKYFQNIFAAYTIYPTILPIHTHI